MVDLVGSLASENEKFVFVAIKGIAESALDVVHLGKIELFPSVTQNIKGGNIIENDMAFSSILNKGVFVVAHAGDFSALWLPSV